MRYIWWCEERQDGSQPMGQDWIDNCIPHIDWPRRPRWYDTPNPEELEAMHKDCGWRLLGEKVFLEGPLMSEDGDWFAFSGILDKRRVICDLVNEWASWYVDDFIYYDEEDNRHGQMTALMDIWRNTNKAYIRPTVEGEFGHFDGYWVECPQDHPNAHVAWVTKFDL